MLQLCSSIGKLLLMFALYSSNFDPASTLPVWLAARPVAQGQGHRSLCTTSSSMVVERSCSFSDSDGYGSSASHPIHCDQKSVTAR